MINTAPANAEKPEVNLPMRPVKRQRVTPHSSSFWMDVHTLQNNAMWQHLVSHKERRVSPARVINEMRYIWEQGERSPQEGSRGSMARFVYKGGSYVTYESSHGHVLCEICWDDGVRDFVFEENDEGGLVCTTCGCATAATQHSESYDQKACCEKLHRRHALSPLHAAVHTCIDDICRHTTIMSESEKCQVRVICDRICGSIPPTTDKASTTPSTLAFALVMTVMQSEYSYDHLL